MKRGFALIWILFVLWAAAACGGVTEVPFGSAAGDISAGVDKPAPEEIRVELLPGLPTAEELGRQHCGRILMIRDGVICDLEAVLCIREAFSLYIPAEGWEQEGGEAIWHAAASPRVRFGVLVCPGDEDAAVGAAAQLLGGGITFGVPQANGVAEGGGAGCVARVRSVACADGTLAFWSICPQEAAAEYEPVLTAVAAALRPVALPQEKANEEDDRVIMELLIEGMREDVPATRQKVQLFDEACSVCVYDEGWQAVKSEHAVAMWESAYNPQVRFWISRFYPSGTAVSEEDCRQAIARTAGDFQFSNLSNGTFFGVKPAESLTVQVWLYPAEGGFWTVFAQYPDEAAEGFGVRMAAMAGTFRGA